MFPCQRRASPLSEQHRVRVNHRAAEKDCTISSSSSSSPTGLHGEFGDKWIMFTSISNDMSWIIYQLRLSNKSKNCHCQSLMLSRSHQVDFSQDLCHQQDLRVINLIVAMLTKSSDSTILVAGEWNVVIVQHAGCFSESHNLSWRYESQVCMWRLTWAGVPQEGPTRSRFASSLSKRRFLSV